MLLFLFLNLILFKTLIYRQWKKNFPYPLRDYKNLAWRWRDFDNVPQILTCVVPVPCFPPLLSCPCEVQEEWARQRVLESFSVTGYWYLISADISHLTLAAPINYLPLPSPHDNFSNNHYSGPKLLKWSSRIKQRTNICTVSTHNYCSILLILFPLHNIFSLMKTSHFVSSQSKAVD